MKNHKVNIITLGCSKNTVDSEHLAAQLKANNIEISFDNFSNNADTVIINTCGFIKDAKEESIDTILEFVDAKNKGKIENLYVIGCLSERYKKDLKKEIKEVDKFFGVNDLNKILKSLNTKFKKELIGEREISTPKHYAYLKISEGCDRTCSFCAIPLIRGKHKSVPIEILVDEAKKLSEKGVKELILIAQDLTYYGIDLYKKQMLTELLKELVKIEKIKWIRLHYSYPAMFPDELIEIIARENKICNYIDIPVQHINDNVLKKMRRAHSKKSTIEIIQKLRTSNPKISIRTTLMVGHPGENNAEFEELKEFVKTTKFDRLGIFTYSEEEDTFGASNYEDTINEEIKTQRAEEIMSIQERISLDLNTKKIGEIFEVIIDSEEEDFYSARSEYDSPEVDNEILIFKEGKKLEIGKFYKVKIISSEEFILFADLI
ncbi:MAG: 30S ribosomal protein S12 methylthiotransferase RimO [Bacteroidales bacterium]|nr:30S ribosomal protein S12 methylthiotransferase RimO [Bacteroidales bacterium]MBN2757647.1 30S ribosomal protein S12 methylthiotransferase RimO [Bacteroidales bacterium]